MGNDLNCINSLFRYCVSATYVKIKSGHLTQHVLQIIHLTAGTCELHRAPAKRPQTSMTDWTLHVLREKDKSSINQWICTSMAHGWLRPVCITHLTNSMKLEVQNRENRKSGIKTKIGMKSLMLLMMLYLETWRISENLLVVYSGTAAQVRGIRESGGFSHPINSTVLASRRQAWLTGLWNE